MSDAMSKSDEGFIVFSHVPKTGGTSITAVLMQFLTACGVSAEQMLLYGTRIPYADLAPLDQLPGDIRFVKHEPRTLAYIKSCDRLTLLSIVIGHSLGGSPI